MNRPSRRVFGAVVLLVALGIGGGLAALIGSDEGGIVNRGTTGMTTAGAPTLSEGPDNVPEESPKTATSTGSTSSPRSSPTSDAPGPTAPTPTPTAAEDAELRVTLGPVEFQVQNTRACFAEVTARRTHGLISASGAVSLSTEPLELFSADRPIVRLTTAQSATVPAGDPWEITVHVILSLGDLDIDLTQTHHQATTVTRFVGGHHDCAGYLAYAISVVEESP